MIQLLPSDLNGMNVLDAGCAAGWYTDYLLQKGADVTAVDFSSSMVEACLRRIGGRGTALVHDLSEPLPFPDASFDLILSSLTLHYIKDWTPVFQEFRRVLKPGATLLYSIHHPFMEQQGEAAGNYFATERITETWNKQESGPVQVSFFTRPLGEIVNTTASCFRIRNMVEPQPVMGDMNNPQYRSWHDKWFQRLSMQPHFLIVQADKMESDFELLN
nr:class I SAM-dependent methyltransferase [Paenibacillus tepidiphilus]